MLDICFSDAIKRADQLDTHFHDAGNVIGPLHGLPVTFKDQFHVKGCETTLGYVGWVSSFEGRKDDPRRGVIESELVRELTQLGAIPIGKVCVVTNSTATELTIRRQQWFKLCGYVSKQCVCRPSLT